MKTVSFAILFCAILLLNSCIPPHALYLRNFLDSDVVVDLKFGDRAIQEIWIRHHDKLILRKDVTKFSRTAYYLFRDTIKAEIIDPLTVRYHLSARSVVEFGSAWAFGYEQAAIKGKSIDRTISLKSREVTDNMTGQRTKMELAYKFYKSYFLDIK